MNRVTHLDCYLKEAAATLWGNKFLSPERWRRRRFPPPLNMWVFLSPFILFYAHCVGERRFLNLCPNRCRPVTQYYFCPVRLRGSLCLIKPNLFCIVEWTRE